MLRIGIVAQKYIEIVGITQKDFWNSIDLEANHSIISGCFNLKRPVPKHLRDKDMGYVYDELVKFDIIPKTEFQINNLLDYYFRLALNDPEIDKLSLKNIYYSRKNSNFRNFFVEILNFSVKLNNNLEDKSFMDRFGNEVPFIKKDENGKLHPYIDNYLIDERINEIEKNIKMNKGEDLLKKKLFQESRRQHKKLKLSDVSSTIFVDVNVNGRRENISLIDAINNLYNCKNWDIALISDGGMGKTVLLKNYWAELLSDNTNNSIPIYIDLNAYNISEKEDFIQNTIFKDYLSIFKPSKKDINNLYLYMKDPVIIEGDKEPSITLMLDAFNEVKDNKILLYEIEKFNQLEGVQIIIASRYDFTLTYNWNKYNIFNLTELNESQIEMYLEESNELSTVDVSEDNLYKNPMILTLYTNSCEIIKEFKDNEYVNFIDNAKTRGEIFWNYIENQITKEIDEGIESDIYLHDFMLKHVISYIAFSMRIKNRFVLNERELRNLSRIAIDEISKKEFIECFYVYDDSEVVEKAIDLKQFNRFKSFLKEIQIIKENNKIYRFSHQYFRDFFSSLYTINQIELGIHFKTIPEALSKNKISDDVLQFAGEVLGDYKNKSV
ncbi:MAG: hypothetical protein ABF289_13650, partial [Clostridiales bacterium]